MHVVHTFNVDRDVQGTVEDLPEKVARSLIRTGRARAATEDEVAAGKAAEPELADDQIPPSSAAPAQEGGPASAPAAPVTGEATLPDAPADVPSTGSAPGGKVTAVPKPGGSKPAAPSGTTSTAPAAAGDASAK